MRAESRRGFEGVWVLWTITSSSSPGVDAMRAYIAARPLAGKRAIGREEGLYWWCGRRRVDFLLFGVPVCGLGI